MTGPPVSLEGRTLRMARTRTVVAASRLHAVITAHHLRRDRDYDTVVATIEAHPAAPGQVVLQNTGRSRGSCGPAARKPRRWSRAGGWRRAR